MGYMQQSHLQRVSCCDIYVTTCKISSYGSLSEDVVLILKFYTVPMCLHNVKNVVNQTALSTTAFGFIISPILYKCV